jgi:hypothetical protein
MIFDNADDAAKALAIIDEVVRYCAVHGCEPDDADFRVRFQYPGKEPSAPMYFPRADEITNVVEDLLKMVEPLGVTVCEVEIREDAVSKLPFDIDEPDPEKNSLH